jgi:hypothetical protein
VTFFATAGSLAGLRALLWAGTFTFLRHLKSLAALATRTIILIFCEIEMRQKVKMFAAALRAFKLVSHISLLLKY